MKRKPHRNYTPGPLDNCQTPPYALDPLLPYLRAFAKENGTSMPPIWDPARGEGYLQAALRRAGFSTWGTDLATGDDFFRDTLWQPLAYCMIVTNPPYSIKVRWVNRCYALRRPFALLLPLDLPTGIIKLMEQHGAEIMYLDKRINFKMPYKGWRGKNGKAGAAQFGTLWLCHGILPKPVMYGHIDRWTVEELESYDPQADRDPR